MQVHLQNHHVKFLYQGHKVKIKVTGAKQRVCVFRSRVVYLRLKDSLVHFVFKLVILQAHNQRGSGSPVVSASLFCPCPGHTDSQHVDADCRQLTLADGQGLACLPSTAWSARRSRRLSAARQVDPGTRWAPSGRDSRTVRRSRRTRTSPMVLSLYGGGTWTFWSSVRAATTTMTTVVVM